MIESPIAQPGDAPEPQLAEEAETRPRVLSERARLASAALEAALAVPGVAGTDAGPLGVHVTGAGHGKRLEGVICAATDGGYAVSLRLICEAVSLHPLGDEIRTAVERSVTAALPGTALESVSIAFVDLSEGPS